MLIDFWAQWCAPCRAISPVVEAHAEETQAGGLEFYKLNIDDVAGVAPELGIRSVSCIFVDFEKKKLIMTLFPRYQLLLFSRMANKSIGSKVQIVKV